jgi:hypothetical protein
MRFIVNFKAFGDFLIAVTVARCLKTNNSLSPISLIAAPHHKELADALKISEPKVEYISNVVSSDVPAIYDLKKQGLIAGFKSLRNIRRLVDRLPHDAELIFDNFGWRERIIANGRRACQLPSSVNNIYLAYDLLFKNMGYLIDSKSLSPSVNITRALIVPGARMNFRVIPSLIISKIYNELAARGIEVQVVLLAGEKIEVPRNLRIKVIPRSFTALIDLIKSSDIVVSADSLPSHLSAYLDVPNFVFSPIPKWSSYWLPRTTYLSQGMATFSNADPFRAWLDKKLI